VSDASTLDYDKPCPHCNSPIGTHMDAQGLKAVRQLVSTAVDRAILAARRGR
jgi:hypothetical protein